MHSAPQIRLLLEQLEAERRRGKSLRLSLTSAVLLAVGIFGVNLYLSVQRFDTELLLIHLEQRASTVVLPRYERELRAVAEDAFPAISEALSAEASQLLSKVSDRLEQEALIFQQNISRSLEQSLSLHFRQAFEGHEAELERRFPDFQDSPEVYEELMRRLQTASRSWAERRLDTTFGKHVLILQSINETVRALMDEASAGEGAPPARSMEDVLGLMAEILNTRLVEGE